MHFRYLRRAMVMLFVLSVPVASAARAQDEPIARRYIWLTMGELSGEQRVQTFPDGRVAIDFEFNDRGRGPATHTELTLDDDGLLTSFEASGVNYAKGQIEERFNIVNGAARWRSTIEQGEVPASAETMYLPVNQPPEYRAILARALLGRSDHEIGLLPAGSARISKAARLTLRVKGEDRPITLYEISGLDLGPTYVWLDDDNALVGYDMGWFAVLHEDWAGQLSQIKSAQREALARHVEAQSAQFGRGIERPAALVNVRVLDVDAGRLSGASNVLIRDGAVLRIEPAGSPVPDGFDAIEGAGRTLMPALWDMHAHISPAQYLHYVASGVLNVRDMANDPAYLAQARAAIAEGRVAAPDIHPMGFIDQRSVYSAPTGRLAETLEEAKGFVREYADENYSGIKLYSSIELGWVRELAAEAQALGLPTVGHIPSYMSAALAIQRGYSEVTHLNMILLQLIGDFSIDTRTPQRIIAPGERGWRIDLDGDESVAFFDMMAERDITHDPTLAIFMDDYRSRPGEILPRARSYASHLPPSLRRSQLASAGYSEGREEDFRKTGELALRLIKRLHERGIRILPGTDAPLPGFVLVSELQYYAEAGIPNADVLRMATIEPARYLGFGDTLGSIEAGKRAQMMLIDGDPIADLSALRRVELVIKDDTMFRPREILAAEGIEPF